MHEIRIEADIKLQSQIKKKVTRGSIVSFSILCKTYISFIDHCFKQTCTLNSIKCYTYLFNAKI